MLACLEATEAVGKGEALHLVIQLDGNPLGEFDQADQHTARGTGCFIEARELGVLIVLLDQRRQLGGVGSFVGNLFGLTSDRRTQAHHAGAWIGVTQRVNAQRLGLSEQFLALLGQFLLVGHQLPC